MKNVGNTCYQAFELELIWLAHHRDDREHECELCSVYERECWYGEQLALDVTRLDVPGGASQ